MELKITTDAVLEIAAFIRNNRRVMEDSCQGRIKEANDGFQLEWDDVFATLTIPDRLFDEYDLMLAAKEKLGK